LHRGLLWVIIGSNASDRCFLRGERVTTNFQSFGARHTDYAQVAKVIDLNGLNHCPPRSPERIDHTRPQSTVAIVLSYEARWALEAGLSVPAWDPAQDAIAIHETLRDQNIPTDALDPREDLSSYRLVFAPRLFSIDGQIAENLCTFVVRAQLHRG